MTFQQENRKDRWHLCGGSCGYNSGRILLVHSSGRLYGSCDDLRQGIRHCAQRRIASESAFAQRVTTVSNKIQVYQADADAVSKDLQTVNSTIAVNFRIKSASSASIFKNIGSDYENVILMPTVQECMKSVCAKYTAEQLITDRAQVGEEIKAQLVSKVDEYGIEIEKFNIVNFDFSSEFNEAIEAKQVAEQNLLKTKTEQEQAIVVAEAEAKKKVIAADAEATSIKTKAEAQAEANKTISESLSNELIKYQTIDKWDGVLPKVANDANPLISLDLDEQKTAE